MARRPKTSQPRFGQAPWGWEAWLASGLGAGRSPIMPGTVGTLWGLPLAWGLHQLPSAWMVVAILLGLWLVGVPLCTRAATQAGLKDPGWIVWDELVTLPWVLLGVPRLSLGWLLLGFVLHRVFDIVKPPPARQSEKLPGGWGIMADDLVASIYAALAMQGIGALVGW